MKNVIFLLACMAMLATTTTHAQLQINDNLSDEQLIQSLGGPGVSISNIVFNCPNEAYGWFECVDCNVGLDAGLILTTGSADGANGPNNTTAATGNMTPGDADLDQIPGVLGTQDACSVAFDIQAASDTLKFNYVFGSEEYLEFVDSFNDVFAFFIEGPGVPFQNIALVPGTNTVVSINNVNNVINPAYYVVNGTGTDAPYNSDDFYICYDGFTVVLEAKIAIRPCETYRVRLVVADDLDTTLDSGVFIQAGSIQTGMVDISTNTSMPNANIINATEGCVDGIINFNLNAAPIDTVTLYLDAAGSASNGQDFAAIPDSIVFYPGEMSAQLTIAPFADNITEGSEIAKIYIVSYNLCGEPILDSIELVIQDKLNIEVTPETTTLQLVGQVVEYAATGALNYQWSPPDGLSSTTIANPIAAPTQTTDYMIIGNIGTCFDTTYAHVQVDIIDSNTPPEQSAFAVSLAPNPNNGNFSIQLPQENGTFYVNIIDATGKIIAQYTQANGGLLPINHTLPKGVYHVQVNHHKGTVVKPLIIAQ